MLVQSPPGALPMPDLPRAVSVTRLLCCGLLALAAMLAHAHVHAGDLLPLHYDRETGRILLDVREPGAVMIYTNTLAGGVGTTSPLLDRGQTGINALVKFERHGPHVLLIQENIAHRSLDPSPASQRAVAESFPRSVLAAMDIDDETDGVLRVDATDFLLSDAFGVRERLRQAGVVGQVQLDARRSVIEERFTGSYPGNTEVRVTLTFELQEAGDRLAQHLSDARTMSIQQHHSFIALPDEDYAPREFHPRSGIFPHMFFDFSLPLDSDYRRRWISRWRLVPSDPEAYLAGELVEPETPIVYHLDPAIPEPYRTAFREGGLWWNQGFEAAGFRNAFQIRDLPEDADPMDARYNVIHWVHRQERGPSVGPHYRDPRTGEIISSIVRMDSFRSLVNHDIWLGMRPAAGAEGLALDGEALAMARRRQHSAHEIGHTLGLAHNFIAAAHDRASVMDYPVALVTLDEDGRPDLRGAYAEGLGDWDILAIRYAYTWFPDAESEREGLAEIISEISDRGLRFITGGDAGPAGSFPDATVWVEGNDMLEALERTMAVRGVLLEHFDERALNPGEPYFLLNKRLAHVYLHHRTALHGTTKAIGGMEFSYAVAGDAAPPTRILPAAVQREALSRVLAALAPDALALPEHIPGLIPPEPFGWTPGWRGHVNERLIESPAGPALDPLWLAHSLAQEIVGNLLHPSRMARVASFHFRNPELPDVAEVIGALVEATWGGDAANPLRRVAQRAVLDGLLDLAADQRTTSGVRASAEAKLDALRSQLAAAERTPRRARAADDAVGAHLATARRDITAYFDGKRDPAHRPRPAPVPLPWP